MVGSSIILCRSTGTIILCIPNGTHVLELQAVGDGPFAIREPTVHRPPLQQAERIAIPGSG